MGERGSKGGKVWRRKVRARDQDLDQEIGGEAGRIYLAAWKGGPA